MLTCCKKYKKDDRAQRWLKGLTWLLEHEQGHPTVLVRLLLILASKAMLRTDHCTHNLTLGWLVEEKIARKDAVGQLAEWEESSMTDKEISTFLTEIAETQRNPVHASKLSFTSCLSSPLWPVLHWLLSLHQDMAHTSYTTLGLLFCSLSSCPFITVFFTLMCHSPC